MKDFQIVLQNGTVGGLYFSDDVTRKAFLEMLKGCQDTNTNILLDNISSKDNYELLKNKIDFIPDEKIESNLRCQEYVYMYCMLRSGFNDSVEKRFQQILETLHISYLKEKRVGALSIGQQILLRCIAAYLHGCRLIVFQNGTCFNTKKEKDSFSIFIDYYEKLQGIALILSTQIDELKEYTDIVYEVECKK